MKSLLIVEPDPFLAEVYTKALNTQLVIHTAKDAQNAVDIMDKQTIDMILMDIQLSEHNGVELIHEIRSYDDWVEVPIVIVSSIPASDFPLKPSEWGRFGVVKFYHKSDSDPAQIKKYIYGTLEIDSESI